MAAPNITLTGVDDTMERKKSYSMIAWGLMAASIAGGTQAQGLSDELGKAVTDGSIKLDFRYRYENVDDESFDRDANASTLRSRVTVQTAAVRGFTALAEFDNVSEIGSARYNSTANGKVQYPVVADPKGTDINQAWIKYGWEDVAGTYGRQRILHGNQRFVGGVGWRQNEQTYDGFRALYEGGNGLTLDYAYVYNVNRIFGPDDSLVQPADHRGSNHFFRADYKLGENHSLSGFIYALDVDDNPDYAAGKTVGNSSDTYGVEYSGKFGPVSAKAAYATQSDAGDNPVDYDADYYMLEGGMNFGGVSVLLAYEVLGAGDGVGFNTPYATLHKFQGWADKFLATPGDGIEDLYAGATGKVGPVNLGAFYHDFSAEDSSDDFGSEWDLVATWPVNKQFTTQLKYANFSSDSSRFSDTEKLWVTLQLQL